MSHPHAPHPPSPARQPLAVLLGDPSLPDASKPTGRFTREDLETTARLRAALDSLPGIAPRYLERHDTLLAELQADPPAFVLNLCDTGFRNVAAWEAHVPALLELLGIPYSGSPPAALTACYDKAAVSALARGLGIPAPAERYFPSAAAALARGLRFALPALIKPNQADGSLGISRAARVCTMAEARAYLGWLAETLPGRAVLVQEFLPGVEYTVGLLGNPETALEALPLLEADFSALPAELAPICCDEAKTEPTSPYWSGIAYREAHLPAEAQALLVEHSRLLFARLGLRDYARMDFRADAAGAIKLLEVNPNPAWAHDGKLAMMARLGGIEYPALLAAILAAARARLGAQSTRAAYGGAPKAPAA
jgi:D-alanine-D-alanine ligase